MSKMQERPLYHREGCKTSSLSLAAYLALCGNEIVGFEPISGWSGRFFVVIRPGPQIEEHLRAWQENRPVPPLDFAAKIGEVNAMLRVAKGYNPRRAR